MGPPSTSCHLAYKVAVSSIFPLSPVVSVCHVATLSAPLTFSCTSVLLYACPSVRRTLRCQGFGPSFSPVPG